MIRLVYNYMVVYSYARGIGRLEVKRSRPISSYKDIESLDQVVCMHNGCTACVTNYKLISVRLERIKKSSD